MFRKEKKPFRPFIVNYDQIILINKKRRFIENFEKQKFIHNLDKRTTLVTLLYSDHRHGRGMRDISAFNPLHYH